MSVGAGTHAEIIALNNALKNNPSASIPVEDCFEFYENGKIKTYSHYSEDRLNSYRYSYDDKGKLKLSSVWENGRFIQKEFNEE